MAIELVTWALAQTVRPSGRKFVLVALANYANAEGECWPSQQTIAEATSQTARSVRAHLADLEASGHIRRRQRREDDGTYRTDVYQLPVKVATVRKALASKRFRPEKPAENISAGSPAANSSSGPAETVSAGYGLQPAENISAYPLVTDEPSVTDTLTGTGGAPPVTPEAFNSGEACAIWQRTMGGRAPGGRIGHALKPLVAQYGNADVLKDWERYLTAHVRQGRGRYATAEDFASRYGYYREHGVALPQNGSNRPPADSPAGQVKQELPGSGRSGKAELERATERREKDREQQERTELVDRWARDHPTEANELLMAIGAEVQSNPIYPRKLWEGTTQALFRTRVAEMLKGVQTP